MKVNANRLWGMHQEMAAITDAALPYTRRSFTPLYRKAREWLKSKFSEIGMVVSIDPAGNLKGVFQGTGERNIAVGSHTDTVQCGGRFDGVSGVLSFVESLQCMREAGYRPRKNILGFDFLAEEPSEFHISCIGSRMATGNFTEGMLNFRHRQTGQLLRDVIDQWGGDSSLLAPGLSLFDPLIYDAFLELHIEQGPILEKQQMDVGLVEAICSVTRYDFTVTGRADHANTPMDKRRDALLAASRLVHCISQNAFELCAGENYFTATTGKMEIYPNGPNVIAGQVDLNLDIRSEDDVLVDMFLEKFFAAAEQIAMDTGTDITHEKISRSSAVHSDANILSVLQESADILGLRSQRMRSGAGHDAAYMATVMPMAMIFIPCRDGRSHTAVEYSSKEQIEKGANLLLSTLVALSS